VQVGLLAATIVSIMLYLHPKLEKDAPTKAPQVIVTAEYILYFALVLVLWSGGCALSIRLASALDYFSLFRWIFYKFSPFVNWMTIFTLFCALGLVFLGVTLQLPVVVNSYS
jgi:hypothetical protein